jgi:hypothetical protein
MSNFKVGDIVLVNGDQVARDWMIRHSLDSNTCKYVINSVSESEDYRVCHMDGTFLCWAASSHLTLFRKKKTTPLKRKGYALWIHNIECKSKRGVK